MEFNSKIKYLVKIPGTATGMLCQRGIRGKIKKYHQHSREGEITFSSSEGVRGKNKLFSAIVAMVAREVRKKGFTGPMYSISAYNRHPIGENMAFFL